MTVRELIKKLKKMPQSAKVIMYYSPWDDVARAPSGVEVGASQEMSLNTYVYFGPFSEIDPEKFCEEYEIPLELIEEVVVIK